MAERTRLRDTSAEAERIQLETYRRMSPTERFQIASELNEMCGELQRNGIRERHPEYTEGEIGIARSRMILGDTLFARIHPDKLHIIP